MGHILQPLMQWNRFCSIETLKLVEKVKELLTQISTITEVKLYACRSGMIPCSTNKFPLEQRLYLNDNIDDIRINNSPRYLYGNLSYAEYFSLLLHQSLFYSNQIIPPGLKISACLGETKNSNANINVTKSTPDNVTKKSMANELYVDVNTKTNFITLDFAKFINECNTQFKKNIYLDNWNNNSPQYSFNFFKENYNRRPFLLNRLLEIKDLHVDYQKEFDSQFGLSIY